MRNNQEPMRAIAFSTRKKIALSICTFVLALGFGEIALTTKYFHDNANEPLAFLHYGKRLRSQRTTPEKIQDIGIYERDPRFGYRHVANSKGTHTTDDFSATYTIGPDLARVTQKEHGKEAKILLTGGSFTFGYGVQGDESFAAILAKDAWKRWNVDNRAVNGWGTTHALLTVRDALEKEPLPTAVIYAMIPHHVYRNYIRRSWVTGIARYGFKHPHFELIDGNLEFQGLAEVKDSQEDCLAVRKKELALTEAMIVSMHRETQSKGVPFILVFLPRQFNDGWLPPRFINSIYGAGITVLDLSEMDMDVFSERDRHPNKSMHRRIAQEIEDSFLTDILTEFNTRNGSLRAL